jgi:O-antigen/teichoic acid export membrane protein
MAMNERLAVTKNDTFVPDAEESALATGQAVSEGPAAGASFLWHAAVYGLGSLALQAASVILVPLYTRCLSPAEFGVLEIISRMGEVFNILLMANGIRLAAFTFYCQAESETEKEKTAATVLFVQGLFFFGFGLAATALAPLSGRLIGINDPRLLVFGILMIMIEGTTVVPLAMIQARIDSTYYISVMAGMFCTRVSLTILFVAGLKWGVWGVLGASAATSAAFGLVLIWYETGTHVFRPDGKKLREVLRFAIPFVPAGLCGFVLHNCDRFFLMNYGGADEVGQYSLGYRLATAVGSLSIGPLIQVWTAQMYNAFKRADAAVYVGRIGTRILAVYIFGGLGLAIFEDEVVQILAVPGYYGATSVMGILVLAYFFWHTANFMDAPLWVFRRSALKPKILLVSSSATVALCFLLIPRWGVSGAAYSVLGGLVIQCIVTWLVARRVYRVHYEFGRLAIMLGLAIALALAALPAGHGALGIAYQTLLWFAWPTLLWTTGFVSPEEKTHLRDICRRLLAIAVQIVRRNKRSVQEDTP